MQISYIILVNNKQLYFEMNEAIIFNQANTCKKKDKVISKDRNFMCEYIC